jgi:hypothetical protein
MIQSMFKREDAKNCKGCEVSASSFATFGLPFAS